MRYVIEITKPPQNCAGVEHIEKVGDLNLTTTDPVEAVAIKKEIRTALRRQESDYKVELVMVEETRSRVLDAFNESDLRR